MIRNGKAIDHSNEGGLWGSLIAFLVAFGALLGAMYALGFWSLEVVWIPGLIALALSLIAFFIPKQLLGRGDTVDHVAVHAQNPMEYRAGHRTDAAVGAAPGPQGAHALDAHR